MEEIKIGEVDTPESGMPAASCPHCSKRAQEDASSEEQGLAFLLALLPVMVLTIFGQVGLL
jgi:hypothetical protein